MKSFTLLLLVIILSSLALAKSVELHLNNDEPNHLGKRNIAGDISHYVKFLQCSKQYGSCQYCDSFIFNDIHYGMEYGKKCCIYVDGCLKSMECPGKLLGYRCCNNRNAPVYYTDDYGKWSVEGEDWCSIKN